MRFVSLLIGLGVLVVGIAVWRFDAAETLRLESSVRILTLKKFEPFVVEWIEAHPNEFSHQIQVDVAENPRFRWQVQHEEPFYDAYFADAFGNSGVHLRRLDRLRSYFGGPLKLLVREEVGQQPSSRKLGEVWAGLENQVVGVLPAETPLGLDTYTWLEDAGVLPSAEKEASAGRIGPSLRVYSRSLDLLQALHQGECAAIVLRADLHDPPNTVAWAWHLLDGLPGKNYSMGLLVTMESRHRELLRNLWLQMQPDFEDYKRNWKAAEKAVRPSPKPVR